MEGDDAYAARQRERLLRRAEEEEELMMRVPLAKKELKGLRAVQKKGGFSGGAMLDDFADDVADLVQVHKHQILVSCETNWYGIERNYEKKKQTVLLGVQEAF